VLRKQVESGRLLRVTAVKPRYHAPEEGRWDFRVTIVFRDVAAAFDASAEEDIKRQLFPDQEAFRREEQRRFEILLAHWDVPIEDVGRENERTRLTYKTSLKPPRAADSDTVTRLAGSAHLDLVCSFGDTSGVEQG
jgi:hypothetical protein